MIPASSFNNLRRQVCDGLDYKRNMQTALTRKKMTTSFFPKNINMTEKNIRIDVRNIEAVKECRYV